MMMGCISSGTWSCILWEGMAAVSAAKPEAASGTVVGEGVLSIPADPGVVDLRSCMHEMHVDERRTCESMVRGTAGSVITPMPTHHIDEHGRFCGFAFSCPASSPISSLPLSRGMFFGHTACECDATSSDIVALLSDMDGVRLKMMGFLRNVRERAKIMGVATFDCRPQNVEGITSEGGRMVGIRSKRTVDSQDWVPEVPDMIGIYHSFVRGHNRDTRVHKLFIIVSGGCGKAADEFYNTVLDCHGHATARDCAISEEAWWLRRASYRSRCRLIAECAEHFGIRVTTIKDVHSYDTAVVARGSVVGSSVASSIGAAGGVKLAVPTIDTVTHDMHADVGEGARAGSGSVHLFDGCVDVADIRNGVLCSMHPSEGFWVLKGVQNRANGTNTYGTGWGTTAGRAAAIPTAATRFRIAATKDREQQQPPYATAVTNDSASIVRIAMIEQVDPETGREIPPRRERDAMYQFFDQAYLANLEQATGWPRDRGVVECIPIVVGIGSLD